MKVILTHEVSSLGNPGDVVDVKDGYARNFLFRRGLATAWTKGGQKQVDSINKGREVRAINSLEEAKSIKGNLENKAVKVDGPRRRLRPPVRCRLDRRHRCRGEGGRWPGARQAQDRGHHPDQVGRHATRRSSACTPRCRPR